MRLQQYVAKQKSIQTVSLPQVPVCCHCQASSVEVKMDDVEYQLHIHSTLPDVDLPPSANTQLGCVV